MTGSLRRQEHLHPLNVQISQSRELEEVGGREADFFFFLHKSRASSSPEVDQSGEEEGRHSAPNTRDVFFNTTV